MHSVNDTDIQTQATCKLVFFKTGRGNIIIVADTIQKS